MNHSCVPNCQTQKWIVGSQIRIGLFAIKDIHPNAELTFDYKFQRFGTEKNAQACHCKEPTCKGFIGDTSPTSRKKAFYCEATDSDEDSMEEDDAEDRDVPEHTPRKRASKSFWEPKGIEDPSLLPSLLKKLITIESIGPLQRQLQILNVCL